MDILLVPLLLLLRSVCEVLIWIILIDVVLSWLSIANILNISNSIVRTIIETVSFISDRMLRPIREKCSFAVMGGFDFSPIIMTFLLLFLEQVINRILMRFV